MVRRTDVPKPWRLNKKTRKALNDEYLGQKRTGVRR
jgi:hypothetical protein